MSVAGAGREGPCWDPETRKTWPLHEGHIVDPRRIDNPTKRLAYLEQWQIYSQTHQPHQMPGYVVDLLLEEKRLQASNARPSGEWD